MKMSMDGGLGIRTRGLRMEDAGLSCHVNFGAFFKILP